MTSYRTWAVVLVACMLVIAAAACATPASPGAGSTPSALVSPSLGQIAASTRTEGSSASETPVPTPTGFVLPTGCRYVGAPAFTADSIEWRFDCGSEGNRDARGALAPAFSQQGWTSCGPGLATASWISGAAMLTVVESSLAPGDYPRLIRRMRTSTACP